MVFTKINSERDIDLRVKRRTLHNKLLVDHRGENLDDLGFGDDVVDTTPEARSVRERMDEPDASHLETSPRKTQS